MKFSTRIRLSSGTCCRLELAELKLFLFNSYYQSLKSVVTGAAEPFIKHCGLCMCNFCLLRQVGRERELVPKYVTMISMRLSSSLLGSFARIMREAAETARCRFIGGTIMLFAHDDRFLCRLLVCVLDYRISLRARSECTGWRCYEG